MNVLKMVELIAKLKDWLRGKKVYLIGIAAITGTIASWANNAIDNKTAIEAIVGALTAMALRAGQDNSAEKINKEKKQ